MLLSAAPSQAYSINDFASGSLSGQSYWGANSHNYGDVISPHPTDTSSKFEIKGVDASLSGQDLVIEIYTNYNPADSGSQGTTYGDLFLTPSTSYHPFGTADHYTSDNFYNTGTDWQYAVVIGAQVGHVHTSYTGGVYTVNDSQVVTSYYNGQGTIRDGEPVQYKTQYTTKYWNGWRWVYETHTQDPVTRTQDPTSGTLTAGMTVTDQSNNPYSTTGLYLLTFTIKDFVGSDLATQLTNEFALSWAMTCANDIVQGFVTVPLTAVPLPATLPLFLGGLGGAGLIGRWRKRLKGKPA